MSTWENVILPNWETKKNETATVRLWWYGLPPRVRGVVWFNILNTNVAREKYEEYLKHAQAVKEFINKEDIERKKEYMNQFQPRSKIEDNLTSNETEQVEQCLFKGKEKSVSVIVLDLPRTFPGLSFFQPGGPCHDQLKNVLEAFVCSRVDLGYVQGMSYVAALLLLFMDEFEAFQSICGLFQREIFSTFYTMELESIQLYIKIFSFLFKNFLPDLHYHMEVKNEISPHIYFLDWVLTLFSKSPPIDVASHILDVYLLEGEYFLFKAGLGILYLLKNKLLRVEFDGIMQLMQQLTSHEIDDTELFQYISCVELDAVAYANIVDKIKNTTYL